jgi:hypothetical protein
MRAHRHVFVLVFAAFLGCGKGKQGPSPASSVAGPASAYGIPVGLPGPTDKIVDAVNPKHEQPYSGPRGTLKGTVRIDGDPPVDTGLKFPAHCKDSAATYSKLFRVGLDKTLADAMVAITGYAGFVPATDEALKITIHRCVPSRRTYALTFGQRVEISNLDEKDSYLPYLDGLPFRSVMVAIPTGAPIKLYPNVASPAHYMLRDQMDSGLVADVFVLNYATHDVTGLDGQYEIKNVPVGKVRVNAFLPVIGKSDAKDVEIKEGDNTLDFTMHFDAEKDLPKAKPAASASTSAPDASGSASAPPGKPSRFK